MDELSVAVRTDRLLVLVLTVTVFVDQWNFLSEGQSLCF